MSVFVCEFLAIVECSGALMHRLIATWCKTEKKLHNYNKEIKRARFLYLFYNMDIMFVCVGERTYIKMLTNNKKSNNKSCG